MGKGANVSVNLWNSAVDEDSVAAAVLTRNFHLQIATYRHINIQETRLAAFISCSTAAGGLNAEFACQLDVITGGITTFHLLYSRYGLLPQSRIQPKKDTVHEHGVGGADEGKGGPLDEIIQSQTVQIELTFYTLHYDQMRNTSFASNYFL